MYDVTDVLQNRGIAMKSRRERVDISLLLADLSMRGDSKDLGVYMTDTRESSLAKYPNDVQVSSKVSLLTRAEERQTGSPGSEPPEDLLSHSTRSWTSERES